MVAFGPVEIPGRGRIAIYIHGGVERGLWRCLEPLLGEIPAVRFPKGPGRPRHSLRPPRPFRAISAAKARRRGRAAQGGGKRVHRVCVGGRNAGSRERAVRSNEPRGGKSHEDISIAGRPQGSSPRSRQGPPRLRESVSRWRTGRAVAGVVRRLRVGAPGRLHFADRIVPLAGGHS